MISRENKVIVICIFAAVALLFGLSALTTVPEWVASGSVLVVGVMLPMLLNGYRDRRAS